MSTELIETDQENGLAISLTNANLQQMAKQRDQLAIFVKGQMKDKIDFGVIPGTGDKASLWKPGAEKIANIFKLGSRIIKIDKDIDFEKNIATFSATIEVFHIPSGRAIAQSEAVCSSQEKKYKEKNVYGKWENGKRDIIGKEPTPIGDVLNTLSKMAQKRAYVSAVISATAASDFFTMDVDEDYENNEQPKWDKPPPDQMKPPEAKAAQKIPEKPKTQAASLDPIKQKIKELGAIANEERVRLGWTANDLKLFMLENFGKPANELTVDDLTLLIESLKKQVRQ